MLLVALVALVEQQDLQEPLPSSVEVVVARAGGVALAELVSLVVRLSTVVVEVGAEVFRPLARVVMVQHPVMYTQVVAEGRAVTVGLGLVVPLPQ